MIANMWWVFVTICDTGLGGVGGQKAIKTHNCKKSLLSFNLKKQRNFVFGGLIINYVNCIFCRKSPFYNRYPTGGIIIEFILNKHRMTIHFLII